MDYQSFIGKIYDSDPMLRRYVSQYNIVNLDSILTNKKRIKTIPFGMAGIIILFENSQFYIESEKFGFCPMRKANVVGFSPIQTDNYFHFSSKCLQGVTISLTHLGVNELLGIPLKLLFNQIIDLELIVGGEVRLLIEQLEEAKEEVDMVRLLDNFFIKLLNRHQRVTQKFIGLLNHLLCDNQQIISVTELARQINMCERSLQRRFKEELGLTPKEFLRLSRFLKIFGLMTSHPNISVQDLVWFGRFYDQSHLIHEFQSITDYSPLDFHKALQSAV